MNRITNISLLCISLIVFRISANSPVSDNKSQKSEDDMSSNFSADMKIDSESSEDSDSQNSDHNNDFEGFLDRYLKYLKVPGHCNGKSGKCNGPNSDVSTDLTPIFGFIKFVTECDLMKESCKERNYNENGLKWNVTKNDNLITIEYKDSHGNEIQSQKWTQTGRIHVLIRNHRGEFIKLAGKSVEDGPSHGSFFRLFSADNKGNHIKCFENNKKRRVKFSASDGQEDSYTIKDLKINKNKGNHWRKLKRGHDRHSESSFTSADDSSSSFSGGEIGGIEILGFGPGGFGFGSPPPMFDCGCATHEHGEADDLDFEEDDGEEIEVIEEGSMHSSSADSDSESGGGFFQKISSAFGGFGGGFVNKHHWHHHFGNYPFGGFMGFGGEACPICGEKK